MSNRLEEELKVEAKLLEDKAGLRATLEPHIKEMVDLHKEFLLLAT
jgi:hypothetical protein